MALVADRDCIVRTLVRVRDGRVKSVKPGHDGGEALVFSAPGITTRCRGSREDWHPERSDRPGRGRRGSRAKSEQDGQDEHIAVATVIGPGQIPQLNPGVPATQNRPRACTSLLRGCLPALAVRARYPECEPTKSGQTNTCQRCDQPIGLQAHRSLPRMICAIATRSAPSANHTPTCARSPTEPFTKGATNPATTAPTPRLLTAVASNRMRAL